MSNYALRNRKNESNERPKKAHIKKRFELEIKLLPTRDIRFRLSFSHMSLAISSCCSAAFFFELYWEKIMTT